MGMIRDYAWVWPNSIPLRMVHPVVNVTAEQAAAVAPRVQAVLRTQRGVEPLRLVMPCPPGPDPDLQAKGGQVRQVRGKLGAS